MLGILAASGRLQIHSDLLALLPAPQRNPVQAAAMERIGEMGQRQLMMLISTTNTAMNSRAASAAANVLTQNHAFIKVLNGVDDVLSGKQNDKARRRRIKHRFHLLSPADEAALAQLATPPSSNNKAARKFFINRAMARLYGMSMGASSTHFIEDPLGLASKYRSAHVAGLTLPGIRLNQNGHFYATSDHGNRFAVIFAKSRQAPFSLQAQDAQLSALSAVKQAVHALAPEATVLISGVLPHAAAATEQARDEVSIIGLGSLGGILLLMLWVFGSIRPFLLSVTAMAGGFLLALVACTLLFGRIHVLTLVFGTSIAGVAVDYCLHFFTQRLDTPRPRRAIQHILPAISMGLVANVLAYSSMGIAPFPGLRQMAAFAAFGIVGAWLGVILLLPAWAGQAPKHGTALSLARRWLEHGPAKIASAYRTRLLYGMAAALVVLSGVTAIYLEPVDDIGLLYQAPPKLKQTEQKVSDLLGMHSIGRTIAIHADSPTALLQLESRLVEKIGGPDPIAEISAITGVFPTPAEQHRNYQRLANTLYAPGGPVEQLLQKAGYSDQSIQAHFRAFTAQKGRILDIQTWLNSPASKGLRRLWIGKVGDQWVSLIRILQVHDQQALTRIITQHPQALAVDRAEQISRLFSQYRDLAAWLLAGAYLVALLLLSIPLGVRGAMTVILPPLLASVTVACIFALANWPFSLFNLLAMILMLGLGADYGIFLRMATKHNASAMVAVGASAITNLLAFGLLSLSATPALHSFGLTLAMGLVLTFMLTSLAAGSHTNKEAQGHKKGKTNDHN